MKHLEQIIFGFRSWQIPNFHPTNLVSSKQVQKLTQLTLDKFTNIFKSGRREITPFQQQGYQIKAKSLHRRLENVADVTLDHTNISNKDEANGVSNGDLKTDTVDIGKKVEKLQFLNEQ